MTGSSYSGAEEYPRGKKTQTNQRWYTHLSQLTKFMAPPKIYKSEIGSQPTMCQVHTGAYVSLLYSICFIFIFVFICFLILFLFFVFVFVFVFVYFVFLSSNVFLLLTYVCCACRTQY